MNDEKLIALEENQCYTCDNGCGECEAVEFNYEYSREENPLTGELIESKTHKAFKSSCCGAMFEIWDDDLEDSKPAILQRDLKMRTEQQIIDQTNELARQLYSLAGYDVKKGYDFSNATHPQEKLAWSGACAAQLMLTDTDPEDAMANL